MHAWQQQLACTTVLGSLLWHSAVQQYTTRGAGGWKVCAACPAVDAAADGVWVQQVLASLLIPSYMVGAISLGTLGFG